MSLSPNSYSEEDVRSKIVVPWLVKHGFDLSEIFLEHSFSIRAGKGVFRVVNNALSSAEDKDVSGTVLRSRADILIKNSCGKNLLVIEVKAPDELLDDSARDQGISYARLLEGNIAPFVILTNGNDTKIFNSFTKAQINGDSNLADLAANEADFFLTFDDLQLRAEAVNALISLSPQNLIAFCKSQVDFRMKLLKSNDLNSGRKYIPSLYIERKLEKDQLQELLHEKNENIVLLVGSPQVGKTNFICRMVEDHLAQQLPCLFYPAIGLRHSLFTEMGEDFEWILRDFGASGHYAVNKLRKALEHSNQKLVVFIDGWNEASADMARALDIEGEQLLSANIQIVISLTNVAADRLLGSYGGNPSLLAQSAGINQESAQLIALNPDAENPNWSLVNIHRYSENERDQAYEIYSEAYQVKVQDTHNKVSDPYVLGAAMRLYQNETLPDSLDEPQLLERVLREKYKRAVNLSEYNLEPCLRTLAKELYEADTPVEIQRVLELWKLPVAVNLPSGFFESALLAQVTDGFNRAAIDFYYGKERDYVICYWLKCWYEQLRMEKDLTNEFTEAVRTNTGTEALRWFFKNNKHIDLLSSNNNGSLPVYENTEVNHALIYSLCEIASNSNQVNPKWKEYALDRISKDSDSLIKVQAIKLFALLCKDEEDLSEVFDNYNYWEELISILFTVDDEYPIKAGGVGEIVIESLVLLHNIRVESSDLDETEITEALGFLMDDDEDNVREQAISCLIRISPFAFFKHLGKIISTYNLENDPRLLAYKDDIKYAADGLTEFFYGSYCLGFLENIDDHDPDKTLLKEFYETIKEVILPIINCYPQKETIQPLTDLLDDIRLKCEDDNDETKPFVDPNAPLLPFHDNGEEEDK